METVSPFSSSLGHHNRDIERLCEVFGSAFSLEAITSAYSQASRDVDVAGVILYEMQGKTSATTYKPQDELVAASELPPKISFEDASQCRYTVDGNVTHPGPNNIVSEVSGGEYGRAVLLENGPSESQPSEVDESCASATSCSSTGKDSSCLPDDIEEFLFKMLGDGFQLDMKVIHEVLGLCGYDLEKSMETLVDLSASSLEKGDDVVSTTTERFQEKFAKIGSSSCPEKSQPNSSLRSLTQNGKEWRKKNKDNIDLQREILGALFTVPERVEERPKPLITRTRVRRSSAFGRPVIQPLKETTIEQTFVAVKPLGDVNEDEEDESSFKVLRQAVKENWSIMKEYYKAAVEAYAKGDQVRAFKLMKEGQFYNRKAREADEKSAQKLLETSDEEMLLDLSDLEPKEAVKLLRVHLSNLAGIPSIPFLKATVGNDDGERKKGGPKRLVLKLLERESIKWTEVDDGKTIVIRLDEINPNSLSFAKKRAEL